MKVMLANINRQKVVLIWTDVVTIKEVFENNEMLTLENLVHRQTHIERLQVDSQLRCCSPRSNVGEMDLLN